MRQLYTWTLSTSAWFDNLNGTFFPRSDLYQIIYMTFMTYTLSLYKHDNQNVISTGVSGEDKTNPAIMNRICAILTDHRQNHVIIL